MVFEKYLRKRLKIFLKNGIKYEGEVMEVEGNFLILNDRKVGKVGINTTNISDFKEV